MLMVNSDEDGAHIGKGSAKGEAVEDGEDT